MISSFSRKQSNSIPGKRGRFTAAFLFAGTLIGAFVFLSSPALATGNHRPTISWIPDQRVISSDPDLFMDQPFSITDNESTLTASSVKVTSSNGSWYPAGKIHAVDTPNLHFAFDPLPLNIPGTTTITVKVIDGNVEAYTSFTLQKATSDIATVIGDIPNETLPAGNNYGPVRFTIKAEEDTMGMLPDPTATVSDNPGLISSVTIGGHNRARTVTVMPVGSNTGHSTITVTQKSKQDATNTVSTSFVVDFQTGTPPSFSTTAPVVPIYYTAAYSNPPSPVTIPFTIADDGPGSDVIVTAISSKADLVPNLTTNLKTGGGTGATRNVTIKPLAGVDGAATITLSVSDLTFTRRTQFLYVVENPLDPWVSFSRASGVYLLDGGSGTMHTPLWGGNGHFTER